ncbi:MobC family plasmid mobilization relaxosome protein [Megasphaera sp. WILCCON 0056]|uniref:MobC family plasmid mobilization relaxosome protein n=1 Tax=Megasphaera sp. WILCCON 0056 TaxID=3345340 RepID=UPI003A807E53
MKEDRIYFRVTNLQKQQLLIHAREENLTLTDYILRHTLADEKALDDEDKNLVKEINRIGINLNQIARALNRGQNFAAEAKEVHQQIKKLDAFCDEILAARKAYFRELRQYHKEFLKLCQNENKSRELLKQIDASIKLKKLELKKLKLCKGGRHPCPSLKPCRAAAIRRLSSSICCRRKSSATVLSAAPR